MGRIMVQARSGTGNVVPLMVRVPEDLRDRIRFAAAASGRSMNSEIVAALEEKYPDRGDTSQRDIEILEAEIARLRGIVSDEGAPDEEAKYARRLSLSLQNMVDALKKHLQT